MENTNLLVIFLTGLLAGGLTCLAVQGGLLASAIAQREQDRLQEEVKTGNARPIMYFLIAKLAAYTLLGVLLGWFGSLFELSLTAKIIMQFAVALFMIGTALNLLNAHPIFRYFAIQPPKFLTRLARNQSKSKDMFAPALLGALTVFIPCGATQAMMALAIASGHPLSGAAILFAFVLGTSPLFFLLGYFTTKMEDAFQKKFMKFAAVAIILLAAYNMYGAWVLTGNTSALSKDDQVANFSSLPVAKEVTINFITGGYQYKPTAVKAGSDVTLHLINKNGKGCVQAFTIPKLNIQKIVRTGTEETITITAPDKPGTLNFSCSMGMYRGSITVI